MMCWINEAFKQGNDIDFKMLESYRGYLIYIARTYLTITSIFEGDSPYIRLLEAVAGRRFMEAFHGRY